jgi:hypothetical protein
VHKKKAFANGRVLGAGIHNKPIGILNVAGYYDKLIEFADHMVDVGFLTPQARCGSRQPFVDGRARVHL